MLHMYPFFCAASPSHVSLFARSDLPCLGATSVADTGCKTRLFPFLVARSAISAVTMISGCTLDDFRSNRDPHCNEFHSTYKSVIAPNSDPKGTYCTTSPTVRGGLCKPRTRRRKLESLVGRHEVTCLSWDALPAAAFPLQYYDPRPTTTTAFTPRSSHTWARCT